MDATKDSGSIRTIHPETLAGDPFAHAGDKSIRAYRFAPVLADNCANCGCEESGFGDDCELCEGCAAELGML